MGESLHEGAISAAALTDLVVCRVMVSFITGPTVIGAPISCGFTQTGDGFQLQLRVTAEGADVEDGARLQGSQGERPGSSWTGRESVTGQHMFYIWLHLPHFYRWNISTVYLTKKLKEWSTLILNRCLPLSSSQQPVSPISCSVTLCLMVLVASLLLPHFLQFCVLSLFYHHRIMILFMTGMVWLIHPGGSEQHLWVISLLEPLWGCTHHEAKEGWWWWWPWV